MSHCSIKLRKKSVGDSLNKGENIQSHWMCSPLLRLLSASLCQDELQTWLHTAVLAVLSRCVIAWKWQTTSPDCGSGMQMSSEPVSGFRKPGAAAVFTVYNSLGKKKPKQLWSWGWSLALISLDVFSICALLLLLMSPFFLFFRGTCEPARLRCETPCLATLSVRPEDADRIRRALERILLEIAVPLRR